MPSLSVQINGSVAGEAAAGGEEAAAGEAVANGEAVEAGEALAAGDAAADGEAGVEEVGLGGTSLRTGETNEEKNHQDGTSMNKKR